MDDLGGGLAGDGEVEFVLHGGEEVLRQPGPRVVVDAALGEDVGDLLPDAPLAGTDGTHALQQLPKVVLSEDLTALLQALVVKHEALDDVLSEHARRPDAKACGAMGVDAIANGDDGVQVVVPQRAAHGPAAFVLNYREILGS